MVVHLSAIQRLLRMSTIVLKSLGIGCAALLAVWCVSFVGTALFLHSVVLPSLTPAIQVGDCLTVSHAGGATDVGRVTAADAKTLEMVRPDGSIATLAATNLPNILRLRLDATQRRAMSLRWARDALTWSGRQAPWRQLAAIRTTLAEELRQCTPPFPVGPEAIMHLANYARPKFLLPHLAASYSVGSTIAVWQAKGIVLSGTLAEMTRTGLTVNTFLGVKKFPFSALAFEQRCQFDAEFIERVATVRATAYARAAFTNVGCVPPAFTLEEPESLAQALRIADPEALFASARRAQTNNLPSEAFLLLEAAATGGHAGAAREIALKYLAGEGVSRNSDVGQRLLPPEHVLRTTQSVAAAELRIMCRQCGGVGSSKCRACSGLGHVLPCEQCLGSGKYAAKLSKHAQPSSCPFCQGLGTGKGTADTSRPLCAVCKGNGRQICKNCEGSGQLAR